MDVAVLVALVGVGGTVLGVFFTQLMMNRREGVRLEHENRREADRHKHELDLKERELEDKNQEQRREERRQVYMKYYLAVNRFVSRDWGTAAQSRISLHSDRQDDEAAVYRAAFFELFREMRDAKLELDLTAPPPVRREAQNLENALSSMIEKMGAVGSGSLADYDYGEEDVDEIDKLQEEFRKAVRKDLDLPPEEDALQRN